MTYIDVQKLSDNTKSVLAGLSKDDEAVITDNGKPVAFMMPIADDNFEETLSFMQRISAVKSLRSEQKKPPKTFQTEYRTRRFKPKSMWLGKTDKNDPEPVIPTIFKEAEHADIKHFYKRCPHRRRIC